MNVSKTCPEKDKLSASSATKWATFPETASRLGLRKLNQLTGAVKHVSGATKQVTLETIAPSKVAAQQVARSRRNLLKRVLAIFTLTTK